MFWSVKHALHYVRTHGADEVDIWYKDPYTAVHMKLAHEGHEYEGLGFSKCHPNDEYDYMLGLTIATGRAEMALARELMRPPVDMARLDAWAAEMRKVADALEAMGLTGKAMGQDDPLCDDLEMVPLGTGSVSEEADHVEGGG